MCWSWASTGLHVFTTHLLHPHAPLSPPLRISYCLSQWRPEVSGCHKCIVVNRRPPHRCWGTSLQRHRWKYWDIHPVTPEGCRDCSRCASDFHIKSCRVWRLTASSDCVCCRGGELRFALWTHNGHIILGQVAYRTRFWLSNTLCQQCMHVQ